MRVSSRSESDGDPERLDHGLRPPDAAAALGALTRRGTVLSGVGVATLAASNVDRAPALVRDLRARAIYSGVGLDAWRERDDEATDQSGDAPPLAVLAARLRASSQRGCARAPASWREAVPLRRSK